MRGATTDHQKRRDKGGISIHAPHAGRDVVLPLHHPAIGRHFNPRAPCGARHDSQVILALHFEISIHAPHAGRDCIPSPEGRLQKTFQSTRPMRGATRTQRERGHSRRNFNPRAPCGARQQRSKNRSSSALFQSTRPMRGATGINGVRILPRIISIHAPHAGRDINVFRGIRLS